MKAYLHIGTPKTATTTIQKFLGINRKTLLDNGYIFTQSAGGDNDLPLAAVACNDDRRDGLTRIHGINSDADMVKLRATVIRNLKTEITDLSKIAGADAKVIFSSEYFQLQLETTEEVARLKGILNSIGIDEINVVVYLRNPVGLANSYFSTAVKAGGEHPLPPHPLNPRYAQLCNHKNTLERFSEVFGKEHIYPRIFNRSELVGGSITTDFMDVIGAAWEDVYKLPKNLNPSLSSEGIALLSRLNRYFPRWVGDALNPIHKYLVRFMESEYGDADYTMPEDLYKLYESTYEYSDEWVRKNYFPHKKELFSKKAYVSKSNLKLREDELDNKALMLTENILNDIRTEKGIVSVFGAELGLDEVLTYEFDRRQPDRDSEQMVSLGIAVSFYNFEKYEDALNCFNTFLEMHPEVELAILYKAMTLKELGEFQQADHFFEKLVESSTADFNTWQEYAVCADMQNNNQESEIRWMKIVTLFPNEKNAIFKAGNAHLKHGNYEVALKCFQSLLNSVDGAEPRFLADHRAVPATEVSHEIDSIQDQSSNFGFNIRIPYATCCYRMDRFDEALCQLNKLLLDEPNNSQGLILKARILVSLERYAEAERTLEKAQICDVANPAAYGEYARISVIQKKWDLAAKRWLAAVEKFPDNVQFLLSAGSSCRHADQLKYAVTHFNSVLLIDRTHQTALVNIAQCFTELAEYASAEKVLIRLQKFYPDNPIGITELAIISSKQSDWVNAAVRWDHVLKHDSTDARALLSVSRAKTNLGEHKDALDSLDKLLKITPDHVQALRLKALCLVGLERLVEAEEIYLEAQNSAPHDISVFTGYAGIASRRREWDEAYQRWNAVDMKFPNNPRVYFGVGSSLMNLKQYKAASDYFSKLLKLDSGNVNAIKYHKKCLELGSLA